MFIWLRLLLVSICDRFFVVATGNCNALPVFVVVLMMAGFDDAVVKPSLSASDSSASLLLEQASLDLPIANKKTKKNHFDFSSILHSAYMVCFCLLTTFSVVEFMLEL